MMYIWQYQDWPNFTYSLTELPPISVKFAQEMGEINGIVSVLDDNLKIETLLEILIAEAIKTSEIEGEYMSREDVMSSIKRNLGLKDNTIVRDKRVAGIAELMTFVRQSYNKDLTVQMILDWHSSLMNAFPKVSAGKWREGTEPMQVISGAYGKEIVHYEAPPSSDVLIQMNMFVSWFQEQAIPAKDHVTKALVKSAITHLYFESIHPFEDGNGRIGRALAEYALSNTLQIPLLLSISKVIEKNKQQYYDALKRAQSSLEITDWIIYFTQVILDAQIEAKHIVEFAVNKAKFFDRFKDKLNEREFKAINRMLESGVDGFKGGMTAKKYIAITKTSKATATRDLRHLNELGVFRTTGLGRSVRYELIF
ncbi:Fic family protein [Sphingobacterium olei]|uniref:Fic family protein n=2 Tax=Sphingobacterium olei TaxID=2571155 RepID=A0A4U0P7U8_9SPHI|nr:Fic family protein [Sphingobacterium olei]